MADDGCHACGTRPAHDHGAFGWLCVRCWEAVCRIVKREPWPHGKPEI